MVEEAGYAFVAGGEPEEAEVAPIRERLAAAPAREASVLGNRELFGRLATTAMLPGLEHAVATWKPDLVLREPCEYASAVVAGRLGIRTAQVAISLADAELGSIDVAAPVLERHRAGLVDELRTEPYLSRFPAALDPSDFPATLRYTDEPPTPARPLPSWWNGSQAPLISMTFGTVLGHMSMAAGIYRTALRAVADLPIRVLLTVGRRFDHSSLGPVPANVRVESWVDQRDVLAEADLVVCHGGSGTVFGALGAGVPLVVVPLFADQFENGRRITECGAGVIVEAEPTAPDRERTVIDAADAPRIARAIRTVLETPSFRQHAGKVAGEMASTPTVGERLDVLLSGGR